MPEGFSANPSEFRVNWAAAFFGVMWMKNHTSDWSTYYLSGHTVSSNFPFQLDLPSGEGAVTLVLESVESLSGEDSAVGEALYVCDILNSEGVPWVQLSQASGGYLLEVVGIADFLIQPGRIACRMATEDINAVQTFFFHAALSFWLETRGQPVLHASSVALQDVAVAFLAFSGMGKSTLATSFLGDGGRLITDDSLPLELQDDQILAWPCHPQIKIEPQHARLLLGLETQELVVDRVSEKVHVSADQKWKGSFATSPRRLFCCYLPQRRDGLEGVAFEEVTGADAVVELVRHSLVPRLSAGAGLSRQRSQNLSRVARLVRIRRLIYPSGINNLKLVRQAVSVDLERMQQASTSLMEGSTRLV